MCILYRLMLFSFNLLICKLTSLEKYVFILLPTFNWDDSATEFEEFSTCSRQVLYLIFFQNKFTQAVVHLLILLTISFIQYSVFNLGPNFRISCQVKGHIDFCLCLNICVIPESILLIALSLEIFFLVFCMSYKFWLKTEYHVKSKKQIKINKFMPGNL